LAGLFLACGDVAANHAKWTSGHLPLGKARQVP
jgi:hypothetical protein